MAIDLQGVEQRLSSLELAVTQVQQGFGMPPSPENWVELISGSLADLPEEDYQRFLDCCQDVRKNSAGLEAEESCQ